MTLTSFSRSLHYNDSKNEPCVHSISWINRWNLTKLEQKHHWDGGKKWLDFGDLDLIFKVTPALWNSNLMEKSLCAHYLLKQCLEFYQTSTDTSLGQGKELIRFWWPWPHFQGHYIIKWALCAMSRGYLISIAYYLFSSPEPKAHWWAYRIGRPPSSVNCPSVVCPSSTL